MDLYNAITSSVRRYDFHLAQRLVYTYDLTNLPKFLRKFIKIPEVVVQPENSEEVSIILKVAKELGIPVVPRGSATSAYCGAIPIYGGIVVDFSRMNRFKICKDKKVVVAESGAIWWEIEKELNKYGLSLRVYPTSAPASTVGGWIAQNGYGVGSLKYGSIGENIKWIEVVDFNGIRVVSGCDLKYYIGLSGTTGLITKACIRVRENKCIKCFALELDVPCISFKNAYYAVFMNKKFLELMGIDSKDLILVCFEGDVDFKGDYELGKTLWDLRFQQIKTKDVTMAEVVIPYETLIDFYKEILKFNPALEIVFTKDCAIVFALFLMKNPLNYFLSLIKALKIIKIAEKFGGRPYTTGALFSHKSQRVYKNYEEFVRFKRKVDPQNLLNPGKVFNENKLSTLIKFFEKLIN